MVGHVTGRGQAAHTREHLRLAVHQLERDRREVVRQVAPGSPLVGVAGGTLLPPPPPQKPPRERQRDRARRGAGRGAPPPGGVGGGGGVPPPRPRSAARLRAGGPP